MESHAVLPLPPLDENVLNVASFAFDDCLAHKSYRDNVIDELKRNKSVAVNKEHEKYKLIGMQQQISDILLRENEIFLKRVALAAREMGAGDAMMLNGSAKRQAIRSDIIHSDNGSGLFFYAQEAIANKLNECSNAVQGAVWRRDPYVTADTHSNRNAGDTYNKVMLNDNDDAPDDGASFIDPSNLLLLYTQMFKVAGDHKNKTINFDFYGDNLAHNQRLHKFLDANKDFIPRGLRLRIRKYQGTGDYIEGLGQVVDIDDLPVIVGECDMELDYHQAYKNMIKAHENQDVPYADILATFMPSEDASAQEKLAAAERLKAFKQLRQKELLELVAAMNDVKQLLPRVGDDRHLSEESQAFSNSLDEFYWKVDAELTKTKNALKPEQREKKVPACDAVAAANRMTSFLKAIVSNAATQDVNEKANAHMQNLATFSKAFNSDHRFRVFKDVAKGAGISFGFLVLAGAVGAGIGFGVGFAIAGPAGAVAVGILGAIIGGAIAAAIGTAIAAPVSGVSIYRKQHERRDAEIAEKEVLQSANVGALGLAAG